MMIPDPLLIQRNLRALSLPRKMPTLLLRSNHHSPKPANTPSTKRVAAEYPQFTALVAVLTEVIECYHVTGVEAFVLKVMLTSISHLESLVSQLSQHGQTTTSIVLSTPLSRQVIGEHFLSAQ